MKQIEGVYKVEMLGPYGWEHFSTAFIRDGEFHSGSAEHFTAGRYEVDGDRFAMEGNLTQYTEHRPIFGQNDVRALPIEFEGTIDNGIIDGNARAVDNARYSVRFRLDRLPFLY